MDKEILQHTGTVFLSALKQLRSFDDEDTENRYVWVSIETLDKEFTLRAKVYVKKKVKNDNNNN